MYIKEKEITRVCTICGKEYKDVQIVINHKNWLFVMIVEKQ